MSSKLTIPRRESRALGFEDRGGRVHVPATYQSDHGPAISLESMEASVHGTTVPKRNESGQTTPLRLTLSFDCNAEGVRRLAEFFGLYDRERWNKMARERGLPEASAEPVLPPVAKEDPSGELGDDGG